MRTMILDGGLGTRLRPPTFSIHKLLQPIGEWPPILPIIVEQLKSVDGH